MGTKITLPLVDFCSQCGKECELISAPAPASDSPTKSRDRIEYFEGETDKNQPLVDEFVMENAIVHLEMLDDNSLYIIAENAEHSWHFSVYHRGKSPLRVTLYEDNSPEVVRPMSSSSKSTDGERIKLPIWACDGAIPVYNRERVQEFQRAADEKDANAQLPAILASHDAARDAEWMKALGREGIVVSINPATGKPEPFDVIKFQTGAAAVREQTAREIFTELDDHVKIGGLFLFPEDDYQTFKAKYLAAAPLKEKAPPRLEEK